VDILKKNFKNKKNHKVTRGTLLGWHVYI